jgi:hypothetical protein
MASFITDFPSVCGLIPPKLAYSLYWEIKSISKLAYRHGIKDKSCTAPLWPLSKNACPHSSSMGKQKRKNIVGYCPEAMAVFVAASNE